MQRKQALLIILIFSFSLFYSCQSSEKGPTATYTVKKTTFEDYILVNGFVESAKTTVLACPRRVEGKIIFLVEDGSIVKKDDVVCIIEDESTKRRYEESLINLEKANAELSKTKANLDMQYALLEAEVKNNAAQSQIANLDSLQLNYLSARERRIKELELQKVAIEKTKLEKKLRSLAIINNSELRRTQFQIDRHTNDIKSAKERLDALTIKAPQDGLVTLPRTWFSGQTMKAGMQVYGNQPVANMPDVKKMKARIIASESDYKRIIIGDAVEYAFDAMPDNKAWGKMATKASVGQPIKENSKVKFFELEATIDSSITIPGPGLTADCKIILKRIKNVLVIPQIAIFEQDSVKVVYVSDHGKFEMREIQTGISSPKIAVIVAGLKDKELISLSKPNSGLIEKKTFLRKNIEKKRKKTVAKI